MEDIFIVGGIESSNVQLNEISLFELSNLSVNEPAYIVIDLSPTSLDSKIALYSLLFPLKSLIIPPFALISSPLKSIIIFESTVFPGATEEICIPIIEENSKMKWKKD